MAMKNKNTRLNEKRMLEKQVNRTFKGMNDAQFGKIKCSQNGTNVRLEGVVDSFFDKLIAQNLVKEIPAVDKVINKLKVSN